VSNPSIGEITFYLNLFAISFIVIALLLLLVNVAIWILRAMARRQAVQNDLDQIGHTALVVKTIRPDRPGQIRYQIADDIHLAYAEADRTIRNGHVVLILSVSRNRFRVRLLTEEELNEDMKVFQEDFQLSGEKKQGDIPENAAPDSRASGKDQDARDRSPELILDGEGSMPDPENSQVPKKGRDPS
jgi:membrane protein implicated in regulation of membrane protease activity